MLMHKGEGDGMLCGTISAPWRHLQYIDRVLGKRHGVCTYGAMNDLILPNRQVFVIETHNNLDPSAEEPAELTMLAAGEIRRFGIEPKAELLSHSNFVSSDAPSPLKRRETL